jgi:LasA protease
MIVLLNAACVRTQPQVIVVTSTPELPSDFGGLTALPATESQPLALSSAPEQVTVNTPTPDPERNVSQESAQQYVVQPGDTLSGIALSNGVSLEMLLEVNDLADPNTLAVGQIINLPAPPSEQTNEFKIIPDSRLVRAPSSSTFDVAGFISQQPGYIRAATNIVEDQLLNSAQIVERVGLEFSVDPRLLLALLEYRAGWLSSLGGNDTFKIYPMERQPSPPGFDRAGLYKQLAWAANQLNYGYYGWKNRAWTTLEFQDGARVLYARGLNAGTVGVQYFLSQNTNYSDWTGQVTTEGFYSTYYAYFGDPFANPVDPLVPPGVPQPALTLPFETGQTWFFTGGPHGGWGSGSAWAAIDFAPPDERTDESPPCYISDYWATAAAAGVIARSGEGTVILDLDMDGDESTGWTILYLHMASDGRVATGTVVQPGDKIGRPSCEGGFSNGTHMHIARRYNGEWIPASCDQCQPSLETPAFDLGGWMVVGLIGQEYQGYLMNGIEQRTAEQGRLTPINRVSW